jgi:hypothetical protein
MGLSESKPVVPEFVPPTNGIANIESSAPISLAGTSSVDVSTARPGAQNNSAGVLTGGGRVMYDRSQFAKYIRNYGGSASQAVPAEPVAPVVSAEPVAPVADVKVSEDISTIMNRVRTLTGGAKENAPENTTAETNGLLTQIKELLDNKTEQTNQAGGSIGDDINAINHLLIGGADMDLSATSDAPVDMSMLNLNGGSLMINGLRTNGYVIDDDSSDSDSEFNIDMKMEFDGDVVMVSDRDSSDSDSSNMELLNEMSVSPLEMLIAKGDDDSDSSSDSMEYEPINFESSGFNHVYDDSSSSDSDNMTLSDYAKLEHKMSRNINKSKYMRGGDVTVTDNSDKDYTNASMNNMPFYSSVSDMSDVQQAITRSFANRSKY